MSTVGERLAALRNASGMTQQQVADALQMSKSGYMKYEYDDRDLPNELVAKLTALFNVDARALFSDLRTTPVVGYVGASGEVNYFSEGQGEFDHVQSPEFATEKTVAVQIKGESLGTAFEGWYAFYDERHDPPLDSDVGRLCIVGLADGRVLIKKLVRGNLYGRFSLLSDFAAPIYDVEVDWAARVRGMESNERL